MAVFRIKLQSWDVGNGCLFVRIADHLDTYIGNKMSMCRMFIPYIYIFFRIVFPSFFLWIHLTWEIAGNISAFIDGIRLNLLLLAV